MQVIISYIFWCNWLVNGEIITCKINIYIYIYNVLWKTNETTSQKQAARHRSEIASAICEPTEFGSDQGSRMQRLFGNISAAKSWYVWASKVAGKSSKSTFMIFYAHSQKQTPGWKNTKTWLRKIQRQQPTTFVLLFPYTVPNKCRPGQCGICKKKTWLWNISPAKWHIKPLNMLNLIVFFLKTWYSIPSNGLWPFPNLDKARISYQVLFSFIPLHSKYRTIITGYKPSSCCSNTPIYDFNTFWFTNHHSRFIRIIELCLPSVYQTWRAGKCPSYRSFGGFPAWHGWWHQGVSH